MNTPENPPAFPATYDHDGYSSDRHGVGGMSLRDYFAAHAPLTQLDGETWEEHAEDRYEYADAMLGQRSK